MNESRAEASQSLSLLQRASVHAPTSDMWDAELCSGNGDWLASARDEDISELAARVLASSQALASSAETALAIVGGPRPW